MDKKLLASIRDQEIIHKKELDEALLKASTAQGVWLKDKEKIRDASIPDGYHMLDKCFYELPGRENNGRWPDRVAVPKGIKDIQVDVQKKEISGIKKGFSLYYWDELNETWVALFKSTSDSPMRFASSWTT